jgi:AraC-like DNA-binding protein
MLGLPIVRNSDADHSDTSPHAGGGIARLACAHAQREGIEVESLLREAGLTRQQIDDLGARLKVQSQIRFLELVAKALGDDCLGFHLGQRFDLRRIGLLYYVLASSDRLGEAMQRASRYSTIANEGFTMTFRAGKNATIVFDYVGVARHSDRQQIECLMVTLLRLCRQLTGRRMPASRVSFSHRRNETSEFNAFFGCDVVFGAAVDQVTFPLSTMEMPIVNADPHLNELLIDYCEKALAGRTTRRGSFGQSVENAMALLLPHGKARAGEVARQLGVSQRTLARRLAAEGLTFAGALQSLRADLARAHLTDDGLSISQIAWMLGYQDISAFTHAFKRWTGKAPRATRQGLQ